eukprot:359094-Chlamydomonas_euryale.AAC.2
MRAIRPTPSLSSQLMAAPAAMLFLAPSPSAISIDWVDRFIIVELQNLCGPRQQRTAVGRLPGEAGHVAACVYACACALTALVHCAWSEAPTPCHAHLAQAPFNPLPVVGRHVLGPGNEGLVRLVVLRAKPALEQSQRVVDAAVL